MVIRAALILLLATSARAAIFGEGNREERVLNRIAAYLPEPTARRHAAIVMAATLAYKPSNMELGMYRRVFLSVWKHENSFRIGRHRNQNNNGSWDWGIGLNDFHCAGDAREAGFAGVTKDDILQNPYVQLFVSADKLRRLVERYGMERALRQYNAGKRWDGVIGGRYYAAVVAVMTSDIVPADELE